MQSVYVNFGSNIRSAEIPLEKKMAFVNVFKKLNQTILWKWEDDEFKDKPVNLVTRKWLPQKEILAHLNIKVFIAHGGLIGIQEAIFNGVPIVGIPIYADQYSNVVQVQETGFGRMLEYHNIKEKELKNILVDVLYNLTYKKTADELSQRFKDQPMSPLVSAMFWLEYVIGHKGADFMKNSAKEMSLFKYLMLDIFIVIVVLVIVIIIIVYSALKLTQFMLKQELKLKTV